MRVMTIDNITSGFKVTGIYPHNSNTFLDDDFLPAEVTNRPDPALSNPEADPQAVVPTEVSATTPDKRPQSNAATSTGTVPDHLLATTPASPVSTLLESVTATDTNHMPTLESSATNITYAPLVSVTTSASKTSSSLAPISSS